MSARNTFAATRRSHTILSWLQEGRGITIADVCTTFGIQYPQAREDLKLLEELYDLKTYRDGRTKTWAWSNARVPGEEGRPGAERVVSVAAAAALELGGIALDLFKDTPYGEAIEELAREQRERLERAHDERLDRLSSAVHLRRTWEPADPQMLIENVEEVLDAIYLAHPIAVDYERADGETGRYELLPRRLVWYQGRLWLHADDAGTLKLFDMAGIKNIERAERLAADGKDGAAPPPKPDEVKDYFADAFGIYAGGGFPVRQVRLRVRGPWVTYFRRYRVHPSQKVTERDGVLHVQLKLGICPEFKSFVLGMIPHVEIESPAELEAELRERAQAWATR